jgi:FkbM family methyltransferase
VSERFKAAAKALLVRSLWSTLGRRDLARLGRFLSNQARYDVPNAIDTNGERLVQETCSRMVEQGPMVVLDVGANVGDWSSALFASARKTGRKELSLHCFEPAPRSFERLKARLDAERGPYSLTAVPLAASSEPGRAVLHLASETGGTNSLHGHAHGLDAGTLEVELTSLDVYCEVNSIRHVHLAKCDAEGHDLKVLRGARGLLSARAIDVFQFEYNWRWVDARAFLADVFELVKGAPYVVAKVTPLGIEPYERWHPELESFREGNYLLVRRDHLPSFQRVEWWNRSLG